MSCSKPLKRSHIQAFKKEYQESWPVLQPSKKSSTNAFCTVCQVEFSVSHGGKYDCKRHIEGQRHKQKANSIAANKNIKQSFIEKQDFSIIQAEAMYTSYLVEHNIPLSAADHAAPLFKAMFPDSRIASKFNCGRTKTTAVVKCLAQNTQEKLIETLKMSKFSLSTDGSNSMGGQKFYPLVVCYCDTQTGCVVPALLSLPILSGDATGENIFNLLDMELTKRGIPWTNCVAFCSDNAPVMTGKKKGVAKFVQEKNGSIIMMGCVCHLLHNAAKSATTSFNSDIEDLLVDVFYYLQRSTKRSDAFKICQEFCGVGIRKILKHVSTRWLSLLDAINCFLKQWEALEKFFFDYEDSASEKFKKIQEKFNDGTTKLYFLFLSSILPLFCQANLVMQKECPQVHQLQTKLIDLLSEIMSRFVKPAAIMEADDVFAIDFVDRKIQKNREELVVGSDVRRYISSSELSEEQKSKFYKSVRAFYVQACFYIRKKFPLHAEVLKNAVVADVKVRTQCKFSALEYFADLFQHEAYEKDLIEKEFAVFQCDKLNEEILLADRADSAWYLIGKLLDSSGNYKYKHLSKLMLEILVIPHSNAPCERIFSCVRKNLNEYRGNLSQPVLESLLIEKSKIASSGTACYQQYFNNDILSKAKKATFQSLAN